MSALHKTGTWNFKEGNERFAKTTKAQRDLLEQLNATRDGHDTAIILELYRQPHFYWTDIWPGPGCIFFCIRIAEYCEHRYFRQHGLPVSLGSSWLLFLGIQNAGCKQEPVIMLRWATLTRLLSKLQPLYMLKKASWMPTKRTSANASTLLKMYQSHQCKANGESIIERSFIVEQMSGERQKSAWWSHI